jgi:sec-independent protein translocase protein TatA
LKKHQYNDKIEYDIDILISKKWRDIMGFGRFGMPELVLILAIALVIFGPSKLPEIGKSLGRALKEFRAGSDKDTDTEVNADDNVEERENDEKQD